MKETFITLFALLFLTGCSYQNDKSDNLHNHSKKLESTEEQIDNLYNRFEQSHSIEELKAISEKVRNLEQARQQQYINSHPNLDEATKQAILNGQYVIGMSKEALRASWGDPENISKSGTKEKWTYGFGIARIYFNFENEELVLVEGPGLH